MARVFVAAIDGAGRREHHHLRQMSVFALGRDCSIPKPRRKKESTLSTQSHISKMAKPMASLYTNLEDEFASVRKSLNDIDSSIRKVTGKDPR